MHPFTASLRRREPATGMFLLLRSIYWIQSVTRPRGPNYGFEGNWYPVDTSLQSRSPLPASSLVHGFASHHSLLNDSAMTLPLSRSSLLNSSLSSLLSFPDTLRVIIVSRPLIL